MHFVRIVSMHFVRIVSMHFVRIVSMHFVRIVHLSLGCAAGGAAESDHSFGSRDREKVRCNQHSDNTCAR
jgi:hypothetical protein